MCTVKEVGNVKHRFIVVDNESLKASPAKRLEDDVLFVAGDPDLGIKMYSARNQVWEFPSIVGKFRSYKADKLMLLYREGERTVEELLPWFKQYGVKYEVV